MEAVTADVIIIGYGPVGAMAANLMGLHGLRTLVYEQEAAVYHLPRAVFADDETMRLFQIIGLAEQILARTVTSKGSHFITRSGRLLYRLRAAGDQAHYGYPRGNIFFQPELETILREGVARFECVRVFCNHQVESVSQNSGRATVTGHDLAAGAPFKAEAAFVLGCDGGRSLTRRAIGSGLEDFKFDRPWLVVDTLLHEPQPHTSPTLQICEPRRPTTFVPVSTRRLRWEFMLLPGETSRQMQQPQVLMNLLAPWIDTGKLKIDRAVAYTFHALLAERWRNDRIFVLGDAAHQMPPFLGQGMCSGIRDAANLGWKIAWVLKGKAGFRLLDSYQAERKPHVRFVIRSAVRFGRLIQQRNRFKALARNAWLLARLRLPFARAGFRHSRPLENGLVYRPAGRRRPPGEGVPMVQPPVQTSDGRRVLLDECLGPGFAVLFLEADPDVWLDQAGLATIRQLEARVIRIEAADRPANPAGKAEQTAVVDLTGELATWFKRQGGRVAVIRPDRYVYGVVATPEANRVLAGLAVSIELYSG